MNNGNAANVPTVPDALPAWPFYTELRNCTQDFGANNDIKLSHRASRRHLLVQLKLMSNTQCHACGGRGHRAKDCPTNFRLGMLSSSTNEWKTLIAYARRVVERSDG